VASEDSPLLSNFDHHEWRREVEEEVEYGEGEEERATADDKDD
jgi:hypothetical protein